MYDDSEQLLIEAIDCFESTKPGCYESLVARLTLIKILQRSGKPRELKARLTETLNRFRNQHELLSSERGRITWSAIKVIAEKEGVGKNQS